MIYNPSKEIMLETSRHLQHSSRTSPATQFLSAATLQASFRATSPSSAARSSASSSLGCAVRAHHSIPATLAMPHTNSPGSPLEINLLRNLLSHFSRLLPLLHLPYRRNHGVSSLSNSSTLLGTQNSPKTPPIKSRLLPDPPRQYPRSLALQLPRSHTILLYVRLQHPRIHLLGGRYCARDPRRVGGPEPRLYCHGCGTDL
jgi:hypothetical protein